MTVNTPLKSVKCEFRTERAVKEAKWIHFLSEEIEVLRLFLIPVYISAQETNNKSLTISEPHQDTTE